MQNVMNLSQHAAAFLFATCQIGAEGALKEEWKRLLPTARFAYSRPGFLTFKLPADHGLDQALRLPTVFARTWGFSLGKVEAELPEALAEQFWRLAAAERFDRLHVWQRDTAPPGQHGFQPGMTEPALAAQRALRLAEPHRPATSATEPATIPLGKTKRGDRVLDCIVIEPHLWWAGYHLAADRAACWPGGLPPLELPAHAVSRAWLKMEEALLWSGLPIKPGQRCVEIGSAPGGASQALLDRGLLVTGIDPAEMHPDVLKHPNFTHFRKRGADVRRREFRKTRWLTADMNVAPGYTLDTVEAIVTHREVDIRGLLLTLKLPDWKLADELPAWLARVASWGYAHVAARQLVHNRQEICLAALRKPPAQTVRRRGAKSHVGVQARSRRKSPPRRSTPA
jgi:23S rRNA (cytidine2498-2'-O)-methyltransferase